MKTIAVMAALCASPAFAEDPVCGPHEIVSDQLAANYGEVSVGYGYDPRGFVVEVYVSKAGTWTVVGVEPDGRTCFLSAGTDWAFVEKPWPNNDEGG